VYLFYLKSLQSKNVILLYDFINFMNFGDGQFWFYEIIVCNILVEPPLPLDDIRLFIHIHMGPFPAKMTFEVIFIKFGFFT